MVRFKIASENDAAERVARDPGAQLEYQAVMHGSRIVVADRWHPSSKTCSACGVVMEALPLSVREWECSACGVHHNRDMNAAKNLMKIAVSSTVTACGEESSGLDPAVMAKLGLGEAGIQHKAPYV